ncbi:MAG: AbrB/MazE/SpoVT family DNA-binding domain-containing protein [Chitinophagaceae bacterium]
MEVPVISIGNSKGIRLSKTILEQYSIQDKIEIILEKDHIILKPKTVARQGWDEAFKQMHENGDDTLLIDDVFDDENFDEWN